MTLGLFLAIGVGLIGFPQIAGSADATWAAVSTMEQSTTQNCGGGQNDSQVEVKGNTLKFASLNRSYIMDLTLQPDGSGKGIGRDDKNRVLYVAFEPGSGPRAFHVTTSFVACGWLFTPKM